MIKMIERSEYWWRQAERDLERRKIEFYERISEFDRHDGTMRGKFKLVWDVIEPTKKVLEVGCGDGSFLKIVYNFSVEITKGYPFFNGKSLVLLDSILLYQEAQMQHLL